MFIKHSVTTSSVNSLVFPRSCFPNCSAHSIVRCTAPVRREKRQLLEIQVGLEGTNKIRGLTMRGREGKRRSSSRARGSTDCTSGSGKGAEENLEMPVVLFYLAKLKVKPETIIRDSQFLLFSLEH